MSTTTITKGNGFTAISFQRPIAELKTYIYNGDDFFNKVDLTQAETYWDKGQSIDIYSGRQLIYSCSITEMGINGKFKKFITDAWSKSGNNYNYDAWNVYDELHITTQ